MDDLTPVQALAESWASIDGKLGRYHYDRDWRLTKYDGTFDGYNSDASEMIDRLSSRGFRIVPVDLVEAASDLFAALTKYGPTPVGRDKSITEPHGRLGRALTAHADQK